MNWYRVDLSDSRMNMSKNAIDKAMKLKPNNAIVRMAQGTYFYHGFREYGKALAEYTKARDLAPSNSYSHFYIAMIYLLSLPLLAWFNYNYWILFLKTKGKLKFIKLMKTAEFQQAFKRYREIKN